MSPLYRQVPSYMALFSGNSVVFQAALPSGMPSYMALYPALQCKQPPRKVSTIGSGTAAHFLATATAHALLQMVAERAGPQGLELTRNPWSSVGAASRITEPVLKARGNTIPVAEPSAVFRRTCIPERHRLGSLWTAGIVIVWSRLD